MTNLNWETCPKDRFHSMGRARLRAVAKTMGLASGSYDIRSNKAGPAITVEVTLHAERFYLQIGGSCGRRILLRQCKGRKDYCGGQNFFLPLALLNDVTEMARHCGNVSRIEA
jgi:hypothetical protein